MNSLGEGKNLMDKLSLIPKQGMHWNPKQQAWIDNNSNPTLKDLMEDSLTQRWFLNELTLYAVVNSRDITALHFEQLENSLIKKLPSEMCFVVYSAKLIELEYSEMLCRQNV